MTAYIRFLSLCLLALLLFASCKPRTASNSNRMRKRVRFAQQRAKTAPKANEKPPAKAEQKATNCKDDLKCLQGKLAEQQAMIRRRISVLARTEDSIRRLIDERTKAQTSLAGAYDEAIASSPEGKALIDQIRLAKSELKDVFEKLKTASGPEKEALVAKRKKIASRLAPLRKKRGAAVNSIKNDPKLIAMRATTREIVNSANSRALEEARKIDPQVVRLIRRRNRTRQAIGALRRKARWEKNAPLRKKRKAKARAQRAPKS